MGIICEGYSSNRRLISKMYKGLKKTKANEQNNFVKRRYANDWLTNTSKSIQYPQQSGKCGSKLHRDFISTQRGKLQEYKY